MDIKQFTPQRMTIDEIRTELRKLSDPKRAQTARSFLKTGPGCYGEGVVFLGVGAKDLRKAAALYERTSIRDIKKLLSSNIHEERLLALLILIRRFEKAGESSRKKIHEFYLRNTKYLNSWDLVDCSAEKLVGSFLDGKGKQTLLSLARSGNLWERRIAMVSTYHYIKRGGFAHALRIAGILLGDEEDLVQKAVGWMLREVGKRDLKTEENFLRKHYKMMPRTMLRYAIERFPEEKRQKYLKGLV